MSRIRVKKYYNNIYTVRMFILVTAVLQIVMAAESVAQEGSQYHAVIIRAAGYLPGAEKPKDSDAITHATSEPGNTYVFTEQLVEMMGKQDIETEIVDFPQCKNLSCVERCDNDKNRHMVDIIIFAGPSYGRKLPEQLLRLLPELKEITRQYPDILCSSMISANYTYRGIVTMMWFDDQLKQAGAKTITGLIFNSDVIQQELDEDLKDFVAALLAELKK